MRFECGKRWAVAAVLACGVVAAPVAAPAAESDVADEGVYLPTVDALVRTSSRALPLERGAIYEELASLGMPAIRYLARMAERGRESDQGLACHVLLNLLGYGKPDDAVTALMDGACRTVDCGRCSADACLLSWTRPEYPGLARTVRFEGRIRIEFDIDADGVPCRIWADPAFEGLFAESVEKALKRWRFRVDPLRRDPRRHHLFVDFVLAGSSQEPHVAAEMYSTHLVVVTATRPARGRPEAPVASSFETLPVDRYAERLAKGIADGAPWTGDPIAIARELLGPLSGASIRIDKQDGPGESPSTSTVTVVQESLLDDSVAGIWQRMMLRRDADGRWSVVSVERAYRCARSGSGEYTADRCP